DDRCEPQRSQRLERGWLEGLARKDPRPGRRPASAESGTRSLSAWRNRATLMNMRVKLVQPALRCASRQGQGVRVRSNCRKEWRPDARSKLLARAAKSRWRKRAPAFQPM